MRLNFENVDSTNSLSRGLSILECFAARQSRLSPSQIQSLTGIPKATLFRLLKILIGLNYLKYDEERKKYFLGPSVLRLSFSVLQKLEYRGIIRPYLQRLSREFNIGANLLILDRDEMVFVERIRVPVLRDFNIGIGSRIPVYSTAPGKAVLAYLDQEKLQEVLTELKKDKGAARYINNNGKKLLDSLTEVRGQRFALNDEESEKGVRSIAVPIFSPNGVVYAISILVPPEEVSVDQLRLTYAPKLIAVGDEISKLIGHQNEEK